MIFGAHKPALLCALAVLWAPPSIPAADNPAGSLPARERLEYSIEWRLVTAGRAELNWNAIEQGGDPGWRAELRIESTGLVSKLFKVNDDYTSRLSESLCALSSHIDVQEGRRLRETNVTYNAAARKASYVERDLTQNSVISSRNIDTPACVHDVVGALFRLRTLQLEPGQSAQVPVSDGKKAVQARVEAQQRETITTGGETYRTIRYEAFLFNDVLFHRSAHLHVWLTDDARKLPVQIRVRMPLAIGTITLHLEKEDRS